MAIADPQSVARPRTSSRALRRALAALGALVLAFLIAYGAFELINIASRHSFDVRAGYGGIRSLEVDGGSGDVHLTGAAAGSELVVVEHVTEGLTSPSRTAVRGSGAALRLSTSCPVEVSNNCGVNYTIAVPAGVAVTADSGDGNVDARGLSTTGPLKLSSGNGDVNATGIDGGNVTLESGNGNVTATLDRAPTRLDASSGNGDVTLTVPNIAYAVRLSSGNGTVSDDTLRIDPSSPRLITANSGNGNVTVRATGPRAG
jgi:Putative adhesin